MPADLRSGGTVGTDWTDGTASHHLTRLAMVAEATSSAVIITDAAGVIVWVNEGFTRITGYGSDEALGQVPGRLLQGPDTDRDEAARIGVAIRSRQSVAAELINYAKDGRRYWIGMKIEPLIGANGEFEGFMAIEADITHRREERQALDTLARRFNMATRAARVGFFERDAEWEVVWWSEVMWDIFGQDRATFKPTNESLFGLIHPEDRTRIQEEVARLVTNASAGNLVYRIIRPDGEIRHIQTMGAPADSLSESAERFGGITLDVTERMQGEERERALQSELRARSHQAGMAEIATGVLHNVGNVLNSLGIANNTARRELKTLRLDQLQQATSLLRSNRASLADYLTHDERGRHLPDYLTAVSTQIAGNALAIEAELAATENLLEHLRDVVSAQQELGRVGGRCESINLRDLVESALLVQASELGQIRVVREYDEIPSIASDRHKVLQIVVNLLGNARDAVHERHTDQCHIVVKLTREEDHVLVIIEDSGIGMSKSVLSQLWRFGFTTKQKGHGFGLHNCANAAHEIGGTLVAHSDGVGHGSRFTLRLPVGTPEPLLAGVAA